MNETISLLSNATAQIGIQLSSRFNALAGIFGFRQREYLETMEDRTGIPGMR